MKTDRLDHLRAALLAGVAGLALLTAACAQAGAVPPNSGRAIPTARSAALPATPTLALPAPTAGPTALPTVSDERVRRPTPREAIALVDAGKAVLVDVRAADVYAERHAAGAISIPLAEIANNPRLPALVAIPAERQLIFYCT
ncbi:MAG: rhodanese-like domain-containing protein [Chloroflexi bacterium]|nr:rhodanese-like domain-containing protein [Chloroflexota bacterium]